MRSTTPTGRSSKGSVSVIHSNDRLQLRFSYSGKRHYLSLGLADTSTNRKLGELKASEIEKDILYERFDETLQKYKPKASLSTITPVTPVTPIQKQKPDLDELWSNVVDWLNVLNQTTIKKSSIIPIEKS